MEGEVGGGPRSSHVGEGGAWQAFLLFWQRVRRRLNTWSSGPPPAWVAAPQWVLRWQTVFWGILRESVVGPVATLFLSISHCISGRR